jgi:tetratricopeptide (TPR) repeat protein
MGNIAFSRNDYSEAIRYFKKSRELFKNQGNEYFCSKLELLLAEGSIELGRYHDSEAYLNAARPTCQNFDEPMNHGYLYHLHGDICMHRSDYAAALMHFKKANNIYLQYGDLIERSILITQNLIISHIELGDLESSGDEVENLRSLNKRIKEKDKILFKDIYIAYYQSCHRDIDSSSLDALVDEFDRLELKMDIVSNVELWILARSYCNLGNQKKAQKLQNRVKKQIEMDKKLCSDQQDQEAYYGNGLHQQIISPIAPYQDKLKDIDSLSCSECGFNLPDNFKFCPGCGAQV